MRYLEALLQVTQYRVSEIRQMSTITTNSERDMRHTYSTCSAVYLKIRFE